MIDAAVTAEIQAIYQRDGEVTASSVLREAENPETKLHEEFEWDDTKAGHEYRLIQSRKLVRRVRISTEAGEERVAHIPSINKGEGSYKPVSVIAQSHTEFELALSQAINRMKSAEHAVNELREAASHRDDESLAKIVLACTALETANSALRAIH